MTSDIENTDNFKWCWVFFVSSLIIVLAGQPAKAITLPSISFTTKSINDMQVHVLITDETRKIKKVEASIVKQVTKTKRRISFQRKKAEIFEKSLKISCTNINDKYQYGCVNNNDRVSTKNITACQLPKKDNQPDASKYLCKNGRRFLDIYRSVDLCVGTIPSETTITRKAKKSQPTYKLYGPGAAVDKGRYEASIKADSGVYFLTPMINEKKFKPATYEGLLFTQKNHPALEGAKIQEYKVSISGNIGIFEKQSPSRRMAKAANGYCSGGAFKLTEVFGSSLTSDLSWALSNQAIVHTYAWQGLDIRNVANNFIEKISKDLSKISLSVIDASTNQSIQAKVEILGIENNLFDYSFFEDNYLNDIIEKYIIDNYKTYSNHALFTKVIDKGNIKSEALIYLQPQTNIQVQITAKKKGYESISKNIVIDPHTLKITIFLVPEKISATKDSKIIVEKKTL